MFQGGLSRTSKTLEMEKCEECDDGGAWEQVFLSLMGSQCSQLVAGSSIISFNLYKQYIDPSVSAARRSAQHAFARVLREWGKQARRGGQRQRQ